MPTIKSNERVIIAGQTGTGKTYLSHFLTAPLPRLLIFDSKDELGGWGVEDFDDDIREEFLKGENIRARVVPPLGQQEGDYWEDAFKFALTAQNLTIFIDEAFSVFPNAVGASPNARAIWTRGRSLGIGAWACTQRPSGIPLFVISEAQHQFCFYLQLKKDRERMAEYMGETVLAEIPDEHGFYYHATRAKSVYYSQLELPGSVSIPNKETKQ